MASEDEDLLGEAIPPQHTDIETGGHHHIDRKQEEFQHDAHDVSVHDQEAKHMTSDTKEL